jgi:hypothetical protein
MIKVVSMTPEEAEAYRLGCAHGYERGKHDAAEACAEEALMNPEELEEEVYNDAIADCVLVILALSSLQQKTH